MPAPSVNVATFDANSSPPVVATPAPLTTADGTVEVTVASKTTIPSPNGASVPIGAVVELTANPGPTDSVKSASAGSSPRFCALATNRTVSP